jgi:Protein of unknown function (DUF1566)
MSRSIAPIRLACVVIVALVVAALTTRAGAGTPPEQRCRMKRFDAMAKYLACHTRALAKLYGRAPATGGIEYNAATAKCVAKYLAVWPRLQAIAGSSCAEARFRVDAATVFDRFTGLHWERKTDDGDEHDKNATYRWGSGGVGDTSADGPVFMEFLRALNGGTGNACFADECGWRLPTLPELLTIVLAPYPCAQSPCIDEATFGPTIPGFYWTGPSVEWDRFYAWGVFFHDGGGSSDDKTTAAFVRAVRAD